MDPAIAVYRRNGFAVVDDQPPSIPVSGMIVMRRPLAQLPVPA